MTGYTFLENVCPAVDCPGWNSRRPGPGWCRLSNGESGQTGYFLWVMQQFKVVGCCPGVQAFTVRCFVVTPVDMLAVEVTNIQTGVWERRDGRWCES